MKTRRRLARGILALDGIGCAAAGFIVLSDRRAAGLVDLPASARRPVSLALGATAGVLLTSARQHSPSDRDLQRAATINLAWVIMCAVRLGRRPARRSAVALLGATAILDAVAGMAQLAVRAKD